MPQTFRINKINNVIRILDALKVEFETMNPQRASAYETCIKIIKDEFGLTAKSE